MVHAEVPHFSLVMLTPNGQIPCDFIACVPDGDPCTDDACNPATLECWDPLSEGASCTTDACTEDFTCSAGSCEGDAPDCADGEDCTFDYCDPAEGCVNSTILREVFVDASDGLVAPEEIRWGTDGRLYVADPEADRVWVFDGDGEVVDWLAVTAPRALLSLSDGDPLVGGGRRVGGSIDTTLLRFEADDGYTTSTEFTDYGPWAAASGMPAIGPFPLARTVGFVVTALADVSGQVLVGTGRQYTNGGGYVPAATLSSPEVYRFEADGTLPALIHTAAGVPEALTSGGAGRVRVGLRDRLDGEQQFYSSLTGSGFELVDIATGAVVNEAPFTRPVAGSGRIHAFAPSGFIATGWMLESDVAATWMQMPPSLWVSFSQIDNPEPEPYRGISVDAEGFVNISRGAEIIRHLGEAIDLGETDPCTLVATCDDGGIPEVGVPAEDGTECTDAAGYPGTCDAGLCEADCPDGDPGDDGDACTEDEVCADGVCGGSQVNCEAPAGACQEAVCDPVDGCTSMDIADGTPCTEDGSACTTAGTCDEGSCVGEESVQCPEPTACQVAVCDDAIGCLEEADLDGTPCDEGSCEAGSCVAETTPVLCVANEHQGGGVSCFDAAGTLVASFSEAVSPEACPIGCSSMTCPGPLGEECAELGTDPLVAHGASGITALDGQLYFSSDNLCQLLAVDQTTLETYSLPMCFRVNQNNVNALATREGELVLVSSAGGVVVGLDPAAPPAEAGPAWIEGLIRPQGFATDPATGHSYVIDPTIIHELIPQADGSFLSSSWFDLTSVDAAHESQGGMVIHDGQLYYTHHGVDSPRAR